MIDGRSDVIEGLRPNREPQPLTDEEVASREDFDHPQNFHEGLSAPHDPELDYVDPNDSPLDPEVQLLRDQIARSYGLEDLNHTPFPLDERNETQPKERFHKLKSFLSEHKIWSKVATISLKPFAALFAKISKGFKAGRR